MDIGTHYTKTNERLQLVQSLITVAQQIRDLIKEDLNNHVEARKKGIVVEKSRLDREADVVMKRLLPLIKKAVRLTQEANNVLEEEHFGTVISDPVQDGYDENEEEDEDEEVDEDDEKDNDNSNEPLVVTPTQSERVEL